MNEAGLKGGACLERGKSTTRAATSLSSSQPIGPFASPAHRNFSISTIAANGEQGAYRTPYSVLRTDGGFFRDCQGDLSSSANLQ